MGKIFGKSGIVTGFYFSVSIICLYCRQLLVPREFLNALLTRIMHLDFPPFTFTSLTSHGQSDVQDKLCYNNDSINGEIEKQFTNNNFPSPL